MRRIASGGNDIRTWFDRLNPLELLRKASEIQEEATRVGEFARGIRAGADPQLAGLASREGTIDFGRKGKHGKLINNINAFWNVSMQGFNKMWRHFRENPKQLVTRATASLTLPTIALYAINRNNPEYFEIPQWRRDLFWHIPVPSGVSLPSLEVGSKAEVAARAARTIPQVVRTESGTQFISFPKPFEVGMVFATIPERILTYIDQQDPDVFSKSSLLQLLSGEARALNPINFDAIMPLFELIANHSVFLDRPIVPRSEERLPPELQYGPFQTELAKGIGRATGTSPRKIEHLARGVGGTLTMDFARIFDGPLGAPAKPARSAIEKIPGPGTFIIEPLESSQSINRFYEQSAKLETEYYGAQATGKRFDRQGELRRMRRAKDSIALLRRQRNSVLEDTKLSSRQKAERLHRINLEMVNHARRAMGQEAIRPPR